MKILVVNAGSSTYKLSFFDLQNQTDPCIPIWKGKLDWGQGTCKMEAQGPQKVENQFGMSEIEQALNALVQTLWEGPAKVIGGPQSVEKVGHRVVHGGPRLISPVVITDEVKAEIRKLIPLAPLHNPGNLEGIELMQKIFSTIPQIAVFDTAFHATISEVKRTYPIPYAWKEKDIVRYGFHGISHHYCAEKIPQMVPGGNRLINCHLGNGASLCAIKEGKSVDTTMGLTPLEGLMMGTRSGSIDPGIILYLMREEHISLPELDNLLNFESGLKGICGASDMRDILNRTNDKAKLAFEMFVYRLQYYIGAMASSLGGIDILSFTAGIGEHAYQVREAACKGLEYLGISLDLQKNRECQGDAIISTDESQVKVVVVQTQEEWMIARACFLWTKMDENGLR